MPTVKEVAQEMGLKTWDGALPQDWVDDVYAKTKVYPVGGELDGEPVWFVWCYDRPAAHYSGEPVALTEGAKKLLIKYYALPDAHFHPIS